MEIWYQCISPLKTYVIVKYISTCNCEISMGVVLFQIFIQRYLLKFMMTKNNLHLDKHVASAREDYICDEGDEDMFFKIKNVKFFHILHLCNTKARVYLPVPNIMVVQIYSWYIPVNGNTVFQKKDLTNLFNQSYNLAYLFQ